MKILIAFLLALPVLCFGQADASVKKFIQNNQSLAWKTFHSNNHIISEGELLISNVEGSSFEVSQTNKNNPGAGTVLLYGGIVNNGSQIVLLNRTYHEVFLCTLVGDKMVGRLEGTNIGIEISIQTE